MKLAEQKSLKIFTKIDWTKKSTAGRVAVNRKAVVCPVIDIINDDNFSYVKSFSLHWGGFNWELHFRWFTMGSSVLGKRIKTRNIILFHTFSQV